jgi:hydrogenase maturation protein HypF
VLPVLPVPGAGGAGQAGEGVPAARRVLVQGAVQGVGFRPFVYRAARRHCLTGWVLNGETGVEIHLEGAPEAIEAFLLELGRSPPPAADIEAISVREVTTEGHLEFTIRRSRSGHKPTVRISADLPICPACLRELLDAEDRRHGYPYINCTDCGPRYSIILGLPYDRPTTTMAAWELCPACRHEYENPLDRRFHAQPVACPQCGPHYRLLAADRQVEGDEAAIAEAARLLLEGAIVAVKGLGGYHLACDARDEVSVAELRQRKYRKEKPFALMARNLDVAMGLVELTAEGLALLTSAARPIVLAPARRRLAGVAPGTAELGVMLPYTPLHHLLFEAGAPEALVMTSANRSSEPIAYRDQEALESLAGIADAFLVGERPIARRVDDSVARVSPQGPLVLRRGRGYAPGAVAAIPTKRPILAVGGDLKNTVSVVVEGQAFMSQHIGDLEQYGAYRAFSETVSDLARMYRLNWEQALVVHDAHPEYRSTQHALELPAWRHAPVQHHRAHVASLLAERQAWDRRVVGVAFDGTGYGDDGAIWGGEFFAGSLRTGLDRVAHLRYARLAGGDASATHPVQSAAGFLAEVDDLPDLMAPPFDFPERYLGARALLRSGLRTFRTSSVGRLFDAAAALLGFTRPISFEGQAAIWLEHLARTSPEVAAYPLPFEAGVLDFRPLLRAVVEDRMRGREAREIARAFHAGVARAICGTALELCEAHHARTVVLSGGVFQNQLLLFDLAELFQGSGFELWTHAKVPPNDGGISLGQSALGAFE